MKPRAMSLLAVMTFAVACEKRTPEPDSHPARAAESVHSADLPPAAFLSPAEAPHGDPQGNPHVGLATPSAGQGAQIVWTDPSGWVRSPQASPMRLATYRVPATGGAEDAELAIFHFGGGQGGDVEANLSRWEKQFADTKPEDSKRSERTVNGMKAHILEIDKGTYTAMAMMPGQSATPKKDYAMLAAVVETPSGPYFVKMTGPAKTVKAQETHYFELLDSIRAK